jgi:hypothetical protein
VCVTGYTLSIIYEGYKSTDVETHRTGTQYHLFFTQLMRKAYDIHFIVMSKRNLITSREGKQFIFYKSKVKKKTAA